MWNTTLLQVLFQDPRYAKLVDTLPIDGVACWISLEGFCAEQPFSQREELFNRDAWKTCSKRPPTGVAPVGFSVCSTSPHLRCPCPR